MKLRLMPSVLRGTVTVPSSKSILHRELICRYLAGQETVLPPDAAQDIQATAQGLRQLQTEAPCVVDCGESGSTLRFLLPLYMARGRVGTVFTGTERLLSRPVPGELGLVRTPRGWELRRPLTAGTWHISGRETSQLISGMLLALPLLPGDSRLVVEEPPVSRPYVEMTLAVQQHHGITVVRRDDGFYIPGGQVCRPAPLLEEPDWSAAAFWLVLKALQTRRGQGGSLVSMPREPSLQGDAAVEAYIARLPGEISLADTPDLLPPLALYAALQPGKRTRFTQGAFLRKKESDRLAAVAAVLGALGVPVTEEPDGLTVTGTDTLHGGEVSAWGDHRIAMLAGCAAMLAREPVTLTGGETVKKSYPAFWRDLAALGGQWEVLVP